MSPSVRRKLDPANFQCPRCPFESYIPTEPADRVRVTIANIAHMLSHLKLGRPGLASRRKAISWRQQSPNAQPGPADPTNPTERKKVLMIAKGGDPDPLREFCLAANHDRGSPPAMMPPP